MTKSSETQGNTGKKERKGTEKKESVKRKRITGLTSLRESMDVPKEVSEVQRQVHNGIVYSERSVTTVGEVGGIVSDEIKIRIVENVNCLIYK